MHVELSGEHNHACKRLCEGRPLTQLVIVYAMNAGLSREDRRAADGLEHGIALAEHTNLHYVVLQHIQARCFKVQEEHQAIRDNTRAVRKNLCVEEAPCAAI